MEIVFKKDGKFDESYSITTEEKTLKIPFDDKKELYLEGSFFYQANNEKIIRFRPENLEDQLKELFLERDIQKFVETVEGVYVGIYVDKEAKKIIIFSDKLKRKEIFYCDGAKKFIASTHLRNFDKKSEKYNQKAMMTILYLYVPKKHTIYGNISRLSYDQFIELSEGKFAIQRYEEEPLKIEQYTEEHLDKFKKLLENAILSRASEKMNIVQMSGGWDSTFLVSVLVKHYGSDRVRGVVSECILSNGETYNPYEIEKTRKIAKYFGVELDIVKCRFNDAELVDLWRNEVKGKIIDQGIYNVLVPNYYVLVDYIKKKYGEDAVVFNGEACDSITNFGFSQYHSISHENKGFAEYADKMMCYLYSPSFFKKILNNSYKRDAVYKIYEDQFRDFEFIHAEKLSEEDRVFEYLLSFIFAPNRVPFIQLKRSKFLKEEMIKELKDWLREKYFKEVVEKINPDNLYYWLHRLYVEFHFQSPTNIRKISESLPNIRMPFLDYNLFKFFAHMPESWGRGLELNHVKYPLKKIICDGTYDYPIDVIASTGPHSYTTTEANINQEFICNSALSEHLLENGHLEEKCDKFFSENYFYKNAIKSYINDVRNKKTKELPPLGFNLMSFLMMSE